MRHLGTNSLKRCRWMLTVSLNPTSHDVDGKRRRLELWTTSSSQRSFGQGASADQVPDKAPVRHAVHSLPTNRCSRFDPQPFRVLLLRRLHLPLPLSARHRRCGRPLDPCGHHQSAAARVCRLEGARVCTVSRSGTWTACSRLGWQKTGSCCRRSDSLHRCTTGD